MTEPSPQPIVLGSASTARQQMLSAAGVEVTVRVPDLNEAAVKADLLASGMSPTEMARALAVAKADAVARQEGEVVLAADQILDLKGEVLSKPASLDQARAQLHRLAGHSHRLISAYCIIDDQGRRLVDNETVSLSMRPFDDSFIDTYLEHEGEAILACVGAYRLEGRGAQLFDRIDGDYFTVLGLPLLKVLATLRQLGKIAS